MPAVSPFAAPSIPGAPVIELAWQGGEPPLMGLPFFHRAVELVDRTLIAPPAWLAMPAGDPHGRGPS